MQSCFYGLKFKGIILKIAYAAPTRRLRKLRSSVAYARRSLCEGTYARPRETPLTGQSPMRLMVLSKKNAAQLKILDVNFAEPVTSKMLFTSQVQVHSLSQRSTHPEASPPYEGKPKPLYIENEAVLPSQKPSCGWREKFIANHCEKSRTNVNCSFLPLDEHVLLLLICHACISKSIKRA